MSVLCPEDPYYLVGNCRGSGSDLLVVVKGLGMPVILKTTSYAIFH